MTCLGTAADEDILKNLVNNAVHMATPIPQSSAFGDSSSTSWLHTTQANRQLAVNIASKFEGEELVSASDAGPMVVGVTHLSKDIPPCFDVQAGFARWTAEEDAALRKIVQSLGAHHWKRYIW